MNKSTSSKPTANVEQEDRKEPLADQAKQAVSNVAGQVKDQVTQQIDARKDTAVEKVSTVADALRDTSDKLKDIGPLGDVAGRAADGIERVASFFEDRQVGDIVRDVERFARREPALFLGGALAIGLVAGRFLKSSSRPSEAMGQGSAYDDDEYLSDDDFDYVESSRFGSTGSSATYAQRGRDPMRSTQPMATPVTPPLTTAPSTATSPSGSSSTPSATSSPRNGSTGRV